MGYQLKNFETPDDRPIKSQLSQKVKNREVFTSSCLLKHSLA